jgi:hypothetical protein
MIYPSQGAEARVEGEYGLCRNVTYITDGHKFHDIVTPLPSPGPGQHPVGFVITDAATYYGGHLTEDAVLATTSSATVEVDLIGEPPSETYLLTVLGLAIRDLRAT